MSTPAQRQMSRGDTLYFLDQLFQNPITGAYATASPGTQPPQGCVPVNITGFTIWFTAKMATAIPDQQAPFRLDNANLGGVDIVTANQGIFSVTGSQLITVGFADGDTLLDYDIQIQDLNDNLFTVETGTLDVVADVTRAISPWIPGTGPGPIAPQMGGAAVAYAPGTPSNWASPAPTTISGALDRLASAVEALRGTPIP